MSTVGFAFLFQGSGVSLLKTASTASRSPRLLKNGASRDTGLFSVKQTNTYPFPPTARKRRNHKEKKECSMSFAVVVRNFDTDSLLNVLTFEIDHYVTSLFL